MKFKGEDWENRVQQNSILLSLGILYIGFSPIASKTNASS